MSHTPAGSVCKVQDGAAPNAIKMHAGIVRSDTRMASGMCDATLTSLLGVGMPASKHELW